MKSPPFVPPRPQKGSSAHETFASDARLKPVRPLCCRRASIADPRANPSNAPRPAGGNLLSRPPPHAPRQETEGRYKRELEALRGRVWELEGMVGGRLEERERLYRRKLRAAVAECRSSRVRGQGGAGSVSATASDAGPRSAPGADDGSPPLPAGRGGASRGSPRHENGRRLLSVTISSRQGGGSGRVRSNSHA